MYKAAACVVLAALSGMTVRAQLDERDTSNVAIAMTLTGSVTRGTLKRTLVVGTVDAMMRDSLFGVRATVTGTYGTFGALTTERDVLARSFGYVWTSQRLYPYVMMWIERSLRRSISERWQPGIGLTWVLLSNEQTVLRLSATASYDVVDFVRTLGDGRNGFAEFRPIIRIAGRWRSIDGRVSAAAEGWLQPSLYGSGVRQYADAHVTVSVVPWMAIRMAVTAIDEPLVPSGASGYDLYASAGVGINL